MSDIEKLKAKKLQLEERIKRIENLEKTKKRKEDTRRKIIIGGAVMAEAEESSEAKKWLDKILKKRVIKPTDRALLELSVSVDPAAAPAVGMFKIQEDTRDI